jgi:hypothetical protein
LPVPHSALDRISPRLPLFILTCVSPFRTVGAGRMSAFPQRKLVAAAAKSGRNLGSGHRWLHPPAG